MDKSVSVVEEKYFPEGHVAVQVFLKIQNNLDLNDEVLNSIEELDNDDFSPLVISEELRMCLLSEDVE